MSVTYTTHNSVKVAHVTLTSDGSGDASQAIQVDGQILKVETNPTDGPSANYDITLVDDDGLDLTESLLLNRHTTNSEAVYPYHEITLGGTGTDAAALPIFHSGQITVTGANMGDTKTTVVRVFYR